LSRPVPLDMPWGFKAPRGGDADDGLLVSLQ
jgi:hypothetical protein